MPSSWTGLESYDGFICFVDEFVGGDVHLDTRQDCRSRYKKIMPNPGLWLKKGGVESSLNFSPMQSNVMILQAGKSDCELEGNRSGELLRLGGEFSRHEPRMALLANPPESPNTESGACTPRTFLNEAHCLLPNVSGRAKTPAQGLFTEVWERQHGMRIDYA